MRSETTDCCSTCPAREKCAFRRLPEPLLWEFLRLAENRLYSPGLEVVRQGEEAHGIFNLRSGAVRLLHLEPMPYPFTAETVLESTVEYVPRRRFVPFLLDHPRVAVELLIWLSQEFEDLQQSLYEIAARPQLGIRLLEHLRELGRVCGRPTAEGLELERRFTVQDLADGLGCSRQWVSKLLGDLEHQGLIRRRERRIVLTGAALAGDRSV